MKIHDYLIDHSNIDWALLLRDWAWLLPREVTVWLMNRYGDLFLVLEGGSVHMLDVGGGSLEKVADSRDDFATKLDQDNNANDWLMIPLVDQVVARGMTLQRGQCYSYTIPPVLGGDYTVENTWIAPIAEHVTLYGSIHYQIKDVPDGTEVVLKVRGGPRRRRKNRRFRHEGH